MSWMHNHPQWTLGVALLLLAGALYWRTAAPSITWEHTGADGADLAAAVASGGIPHPTGYPTYLLLGEVARALLPGADPARSLVLLSALSAALAAAFTGLSAWEALGWATPGPPGIRLAGAVLSGAMLAVTPLVWSQATIAEVYTLNLAFIAASWWLALRWQRAPTQERRWLLGLALLLGLGLGNHLTLLLVLPGLALATARRTGPRAGLAALLVLGGGLSVYLLLPLRARALPPVLWGEPSTIEGFWWLVSGTLYRPYLFALPAQYLGDRLMAGASLWSQQFTWVGIALGLWGWAQLLQARPRLALGFLVTTALYGAYALTYNTTDSYLFLLAALPAFAIAVGFGFATLLGLLPSPLPQRLIGGGLLLSLPLWSLLSNYAEMDLSRERAASLWMQEALAEHEGPTLILADTDPHLFALWYGRYALGLGEEVKVVGRQLLPYRWYRAHLEGQEGEISFPLQELPFPHYLAAFLSANAGRYALWSTEMDPALEQAFLFQEVGVLWRMTPR